MSKLSMKSYVVAFSHNLHCPKKVVIKPMVISPIIMVVLEYSMLHKSFKVISSFVSEEKIF